MHITCLEVASCRHVFLDPEIIPFKYRHETHARVLSMFAGVIESILQPSKTQALWRDGSFWPRSCVHMSLNLDQACLRLYWSQYAATASASASPACNKDVGLKGNSVIRSAPSVVRTLHCSLKRSLSRSRSRTPAAFSFSVLALGFCKASKVNLARKHPHCTGNTITSCRPVQHVDPHFGM